MSDLSSETNPAATVGIATVVIAFVVPCLLVAQASPFYTSRWPLLAPSLWAGGLIGGGVAMLPGPRSRRRGAGVLIGTLVGATLFVLTLVVVLFVSQDWD